MALFSGAVRFDGAKYVIDDTAIQDSMAKAMDDAMKDAYQKLKGSPLPDKGQEDRRMLFVAIAQGMLSYLRTHENDMVASMNVTPAGGPAVNLGVNTISANINTDPPA
jgi:hypothetical protein